MGQLPAFHAARDPKRAAITVGELRVSREAFEARTNRRARMLAAEGVTQDDLVTIALPNGLEFYETVFAVWKLGATPNPVCAKLPKGELSDILDLARPRLVVGLDGLTGEIATVVKGVAVSPDLSADPLPPAVAKSWKAIPSGGSTGRPKLILAAEPSVFDPMSQPALMTRDQVFLNPGPLYHNGPFLVSHFALMIGSHVVEMERFDAERALSLVAAHGVNWVNLVPTMMHRIWRLGPDVRARYDMSSLRTVVHMASACPGWLKEAWIDWLGPDRIWELYGATENLGSTVIGGRDWLTHRGSVGRVQPGSALRILDSGGRDCAVGEVGEIYFRPDTGPDTTFRYVGAEVIRRGDWQSVGDLGYLDEDGFLYLADRRSDLIISGGANVYPAEVEAALDAHPLVGSSAVIGLADEDLGQRVHAIVQADALDEDTLIAFLSERLARYKIPRSFEFTGTMLRDDAGKVRRSALKAAREVAPS